jgi:hypothetical protein
MALLQAFGTVNDVDDNSRDFIKNPILNSMVTSRHSRFADNEDSAVMKALGNLFNPQFLLLDQILTICQIICAKLVLKGEGMNFWALSITLEL